MALIDEIGPWSEIKLEIIREYAGAYAKIMAAQERFKFDYVDAFAGAGKHLSKMTGELVPGSPQIALGVEPPFTSYHFIDIHKARAGLLRELEPLRPGRVYVHEGDCNPILLSELLPRYDWSNFHRALMLLDPYGMHLDWRVIRAAGQTRSVDLFVNFPVMDINRNVLKRVRDKVDADDRKRMNDLWGDNSWEGAAFSSADSLFEEFQDKQSNSVLASTFRDRLLKVAGFQHVPEPLPMKNSKNAVVYYLFFASQKPAAKTIVRDIFKKWGKL